MTLSLSPSLEWLEADERGGFASGTTSLERTRRYHALLLSATNPPGGRMVLVSGMEAWLSTPQGEFPLTSQRYLPDTLSPHGAARIASFDCEPWPRWLYQLENGIRIEHSLLVPRGTESTVLRWKLLKRQSGVRLRVRPLLSCRDFHSLDRERADVNAEPRVSLRHVRWQPNPGAPAVDSWADATYRHEPVWYRNFFYTKERERGLDSVDDLFSPGILEWDLSGGEAVWVLSAGGAAAESHPAAEDPAAWAKKQTLVELRRRQSFPTRLHRAADSYIVPRAGGSTIVAGYPWFGDWGRDTFIALRGLCFATGRMGEAREILVQWAGLVSEGMLPNRFSDAGETPEYNSVDASLWFVIVAGEYLEAMKRLRKRIAAADRKRISEAVQAILEGYSRGTRYGIRMDGDGLLAAGAPGVQLTWMDAKVDDWVVTPRIGKPVEVQALWIHALQVGMGFQKSWSVAFHKARAAFVERFWNEDRGMLFDVVDVDHEPGRCDPAFRPNQLFAVGGLALTLVDAAKARQVVDLCEKHLWTPIGPRSLAPGEAGYSGQMLGDRRARDGAYHNGTVWPWLAGAFVESWFKAHGATNEALREARTRFLDPLLGSLDTAGLGHITEVADGDAPHAARGCPFQAWSVGEALRLDLEVLAEPKNQ